MQLPESHQGISFSKKTDLKKMQENEKKYKQGELILPFLYVAIKCIFYTCIHRHNRKLNTPIYHQYLLQEGGILFFFPLHYSAFFNLNLFLPQLYLRYNILQVQGLVQAPGTISSSPQISFLLLTFMTTSVRENN